MKYRCTVCQNVEEIPTNSAFPHCCKCGSSAWMSPPEFTGVATSGYVAPRCERCKTLEDKLDAAVTDFADACHEIGVLRSRLDACTWHLISDRKPTIEGRYLVAERIHGAWCEARARWHNDAPGLWKHVEAWLGPLPEIVVERQEPYSMPLRRKVLQP